MKKLKVKYPWGIFTYPQLGTSTMCRHQAGSGKHPDTAVTEEAWVWCSFYKPEAFCQFKAKWSREWVYDAHIVFIKLHLSKCKHCKLHHRIKNTRLSTLCCTLNYSVKTGKASCILKPSYIYISNHHKDKKNLRRIQQKLYLKRATVQFTTEIDTEVHKKTNTTLKLFT